MGPARANQTATPFAPLRMAGNSRHARFILRLDPLHGVNGCTPDAELPVKVRASAQACAADLSEGSQSGNTRTDLRQILLVAGKRRLAIEALMRAAVIDLLQPGPQARIEIVETQDLAFIDFTEELIAAGAVPTLELPLALR